MRRRWVMVLGGVAALAVLVGVVAFATGAFDSDEEPEDRLTQSSPGETAAEPASVEFCAGVTQLDTALTQVPDDPAQFGTFVAEQITPTVAAIRAALPRSETAPDAEAVLTAVEQAAATGDGAAFDTPAFAAAQARYYPYVAEACDYPLLEAVATDHAFAGIPALAKAGPTVLTLANNSAGGEFHEIALVKLVPEATLPLEEFVALPPEEAEALIDPATFGLGAYAAPGETGGAIVELTAGRWVYACFVPTGTTDPAAEGTGPPHAANGMYGEVTVS